MITAEVIGKSISAVDQERVYNRHLGRWTWAIRSITLDNGRRIIFLAQETEEMPIVDAWLSPKDE